MKKLIAYSSVAHMGFVTLGIFTLQQQGIEGSIIQMISHGLVSAALFLCVGVVYDRMHSRMIHSYGGIVAIIPKYSILFMLFTLAALGLPGTSGFIGEFLILMGAFKDNFLVAVIASLGVILGAAYMLWLYKRVVFGKLVNEDLKKMFDLNRSEYLILSCLAVPTLFFGFYPDPLINTIEVSIEDLIRVYKMNISDLFKSTIRFKSELIIFPKTTLLYNQSIYAAPIITPKLAITATKKLSLNAPIKIKNSPTNPLVPGRPKAANVNNINKTEYLGIILTIPP